MFQNMQDKMCIIPRPIRRHTLREDCKISRRAELRLMVAQWTAACLVMVIGVGQVHAALIAVSPVDTGDRSVYQWDTNNGNAFSQWNTTDGAVSDIAFDPVTGDLYALTQGWIERRTSGG